jgi:hypothetical protein
MRAEDRMRKGECESRKTEGRGQKILNSEVGMRKSEKKLADYGRQKTEDRGRQKVPEIESISKLPYNYEP